MSGFRRGADEAKNASKAGASFARTHFFSLEDGKSCILRFLTDADELIVVDQHQMVPTKKTPFQGWPKDENGKPVKWPEKMGAVCRKDPAFDFPDCFIDDNLVDGKIVKRASARNWALACLREEVKEGGKVVGYRDLTREVKMTRDGKEETLTEKAIVVVNMGYKNFFSILQGFAGRYGTMLDRDYYIKREGSDTSTIYQIVPNDPVPAKNPNTDEMEVLDLRQPYFKDRYKTDLNLEEIITERASDEFYAKFFDTRYTVVEEKDGDKHTGYKVVPVGSAEAKATPSSNGSTGTESAGEESGGIDPERMGALASRVRGYGGGGDAPAAEPEKETAAASGGMQDFG